jgi:chemotaxis protein MotB
MAKPPEEKENKERWLLTYADLITLLMIFFVVMYALSAVDVKKYQALARALNVVFGGGLSMVGESSGTSVVPLPSTSPASSDTLEAVRASAEEMLSQGGVQLGSSAQVEQQGLVITLENRLVFQPAHADISALGRKQLVKLGALLRDSKLPVRVEGHTDDVPVHTAEFPSNWQLSAVRAANIAQLLVEQAGVDPRRISAVGLADSRPIADNRTAAGRARNRRVTIVIPR